MSKQYLYKETYCSAAHIARAECIPPGKFRKKLNELGNVQEALEAIKTQDNEMIPEKYQGSNLIVVFEQPIKAVTAAMQPTLRKPYFAELCRSWSKLKRADNGTRTYYIIRLENGKALIVYPGEFEIVSIA